ncbi:hypothetical protein B0J13DRAFT_26056 [Dactylonectria estremocensis]|uniref:Uncharacterized protein n=1 Tax=Dactylonectria estremocensis TaxID=1079267 RepID=A0A9P9JIM7_9HYPO|nr:hypothetical protein B0J13DRAFT_26056 [Dactylonectria estremocensis]
MMNGIVLWSRRPMQGVCTSSIDDSGPSASQNTHHSRFELVVHTRFPVRIEFRRVGNKAEEKRIGLDWDLVMPHACSVSQSAHHESRATISPSNSRISGRASSGRPACAGTRCRGSHQGLKQNNGSGAGTGVQSTSSNGFSAASQRHQPRSAGKLWEGWASSWCGLAGKVDAGIKGMACWMDGSLEPTTRAAGARALGSEGASIFLRRSQVRVRLDGLADGQTGPRDVERAWREGSDSERGSRENLVAVWVGKRSLG